MSYDIVVVGAGAAGMMSASTAATKGARVLLIDKMEKCGRKIRITGKGRCNVTNNKSHDEFMSKIRAGADFVRSAFLSFDNISTAAFFESIGVNLKTEQGGRLYPQSGDAWSIADGLEKWCKKKGVETLYNTKVTSLVTRNGECVGVEVEGRSGRYNIECGAVIIATGGVSYPRTGSDGDGYKLADSVGHNIEPIRPSLVPFEIALPKKELLKGVILKNIKISLLINNENVADELGEVEFFDFGIGGGAVFRLSRNAVDALYDGDKVDFVIDTKPALSVQKLLGRIQRELDENPTMTVGVLMQKLLPTKIINHILTSGKLKKDVRVSLLDEKSRIDIINALKGWTLPVIDHRGFREAVVTAGGVETTQVDSQTMESKLVKRLYFAGEVLDIDADTGGYNLQLAFSTGHMAGYKAAESVLMKNK